LKVTMQLRLLPSGTAAAALKDTVESFNNAAAWLLPEVMREKIPARAMEKFAVSELKRRFKLDLGLVRRCVALVLRDRKRANAGASALLRHLYAPVPLLLHEQVNLMACDRVVISTVAGVVTVPFVVAGYRLARFDWAAQQCDLIYQPNSSSIDDRWSLLFTADLPNGTVLPSFSAAADSGTEDA